MKKHILLIDDDSDELLIFNDTLEELPGEYKCSYASSAKQGLNMLQHLKPNFIFVDYNLPIMTGIELVAEIRKKSRHRHVPLYIYSTKITEETRLTAEKLGATGCVEKPNSMEMMKIQLQKVLSAKMTFHKENS